MLTGVKIVLISGCLFYSLTVKASIEHGLWNVIRQMAIKIRVQFVHNTRPFVQRGIIFGHTFGHTQNLSRSGATLLSST